MQIKEFFDPNTNTLSYVVADEKTKQAVVIDPVCDLDPTTNTLTSDSADHILDYLYSQKFQLNYIIETHVHADHLTGAQILKREFSKSKVVINQKVSTVRAALQALEMVAPAPTELEKDGGFDVLMEEKMRLHCGALEIRALATPGHTPACTSYLIGDALFVGDTIFMPDLGTGRCDFPGGSAAQLFASIKEKIYSLPDSTRIFVGHDYPPAERGLRFQTTVAEEKAKNIHVRHDTSINDFVKLRETRDKTLKEPRLFHQSLKHNINAGISI